jgi:hypothetical protein
VESEGTVPCSQESANGFKELISSSRPCIAFRDIIQYVEAFSPGSLLVTVHTHHSLTIIYTVVLSVQCYNTWATCFDCICVIFRPSNELKTTVF